MNRLRPLALLWMAAALAACSTVGPDFKAPQIAAPAAFKASSSPLSPSPQAPTAWASDWWRLFGDATLDRLEQQALADSPTLAAAAARTERARALASAAGADGLPRIDGAASAQRFRTSREVATAPVVLGQRRAILDNQFGAQVNLGWELDLWGRVRRQTEVAQAQLDAATLDAAAARVGLTTDVAATYWQLRALDDEARVLAAARGSRNDALKVVQQRFDAGATTDLDLNRARTELANAEADVADLARRRVLAENQLALLTGQAPSALSVPPAAPLAAPPQVVADLPAEVLKRRPDVAQSLVALHAATAQIGVAEGAFYPSIRLTGSFGFASDDLGSLLSSPARLFGIGPTLSLPVFDGGRNQAGLGAARAQADEQLAGFRQRLLVALREVDDALAELRARVEIGAAQGRASEAAARAARVARIRYEQGASSYLEVTDAERTQLAAERALAQTRAASWAATVQLVKALGGGWQPGA